MGGLAEGATFEADGSAFSISYHGGDGNDVVLTAHRSPYIPMTRPVRVLDTRPHGTIGYDGPRPEAGTVVSFDVAGSHGVADDAEAVVLNEKTATETASPGWATAWPCGEPQPNASNLNFGTGQTVPNLVLSKVGDDGQVCVHTVAPTHLFADLQGWYPATSESVPASPADTPRRGRWGRSATAARSRAQARSSRSPSRACRCPLGRVHGRPQHHSHGGQRCLHGSRSGRAANRCPGTSNLNVSGGQTLPNLVVTEVGVGGTVCIYTHGGAHLIADVQGWYHRGSTSYRPVLPVRVKDSRLPLDANGWSPPKLSPIATSVIDVAGANGVPADATAAVLNITATQPDAPGWITVWPCGEPPPLASNLNVTAGQTVANLVISEIGSGGRDASQRASRRTSSPTCKVGIRASLRVAERQRRPRPRTWFSGVSAESDSIDAPMGCQGSVRRRCGQTSDGPLECRGRALIRPRSVASV